MLRRYLVVNFAFSALSTAAYMALMPSSSSLLHTARTGFSAFAMQSELLSPLVFRTISLR